MYVPVLNTPDRTLCCATGTSSGEEIRSWICFACLNLGEDSWIRLLAHQVRICNRTSQCYCTGIACNAIQDFGVAFRGNNEGKNRWSLTLTRGYLDSRLNVCLDARLKHLPILQVVHDTKATSSQVKDVYLTENPANYFLCVQGLPQSRIWWLFMYMQGRIREELTKRRCPRLRSQRSVLVF